MTPIQTLVEAVHNGQEQEAIAMAEKAILSGVDPGEITEALTSVMREVGDQFGRMEIFLPEMMYAARAMQAVMKVLEPALQKAAVSTEKKGRVVIGAVEGDMHEIGKNIVITLLQAHGFEVHDLGFNVDALDFARKAEEVNADIIGLSALMTTTMPGQKEVIEILKAKGIRDKYHVAIGGAPVTREWVKECGADSWGENGKVAIETLERVMAEKRA
jgi:corrinoid protein of di/trimethylamine methyltransferase